MARSDYLFTSESVSEGHPDKVCDRISDAVVDAYLGAQPDARVAVETLVTTNRIVLAGEVRGPSTITHSHLEDIAREAVKQIGYEQKGFHWRDAAVEVYVHSQSADIAQGVDAAGNKDEGAGDQGIMFGYACTETPALMPAPIYYAHNILKAMADARHSGAQPGFEPDAKSQVTLRYENGKPVCATSVVVSTQHGEALSTDQVREIVRPFVLDVLPEGWMCEEPEFYVNPTGRFVIGGPDGDSGLTGRKIIVDTYGGAAPHGGGAFSGKDPTKVDRSAAYACRYLAKNVVAAGLADRCTIQISYAIGVSKPLSLYVDLHGTGHVDESKLEKVLGEVMDLSPRGIREHLKLNRPIYARTSAYGHFGREPEPDGGFSWEKIGLVGELKGAFAEEVARRLLYGRHKGHKLRPRQAGLLKTLLPRLRIPLAEACPADVRTLFPAPVDAVHLEIGFGGGEHLAFRAAENPGTGFIGCEPFVNGVAKLLVEIEERALSNVRVHDDDARQAIDWLPAGSLDCVWLLYPDPWPKRRHRKRRFLTGDNLDALARAMKSGAELRFATDIADYADRSLRVIAGRRDFEWTARRADDWRIPWRPWPGTRYEEKAIRAGRTPCYLTFRRL